MDKKSQVINTSEMKVNDKVKMNDLIMLKINESEFILMMPGDKVKKGELPFELTLPVASKEDVLSTLLRVNHQSDWYSMMLSEMIREKIIPQLTI